MTLQTASLAQWIRVLGYEPRDRSSNLLGSTYGVYVVSGLAYMLVAHEAAVRICLDTPI